MRGHGWSDFGAERGVRMPILKWARGYGHTVTPKRGKLLCRGVKIQSR